VLIGVVILCGFAVLWSAAGLTVLHVPLWVYGTLLFAGAAMLWTCLCLAGGRWPDATPEQARRTRRLVGIWSGVEFIAIAIASGVLVWRRMPGEILPAIAIVVGLHFIPLARGLPMPPYYATAAGLGAIGLMSFFLPKQLAWAVCGLGGAAIFCATAVWASARSPRRRMGS
jgi:hypothetical protein